MRSDNSAETRVTSYVNKLDMIERNASNQISDWMKVMGALQCQTNLEGMVV